MDHQIVGALGAIIGSFFAPENVVIGLMAGAWASASYGRRSPPNLWTGLAFGFVLRFALERVFDVPFGFGFIAACVAITGWTLAFGALFRAIERWRAGRPAVR